MALADQRCEACTGNTPTVGPDEAAALARDIDDAWEVVGVERLRRRVKTGDFAESMALAVRIGFVAEAEGHHPDLEIGWGRVGIEITTHAVKGLTRNDFILAAKIDRLLR
jgi:4a-hydroxytetrahydrobiopterin dehydratase